MITVRVKGGLGNQLFQYAMAYSLAQTVGEQIVLDTSFFSGQKLRGFKLANLNVKYYKLSTGADDSLVIRLLKNRYVNKLFRKLKWNVIPYGRGKRYLLEYDHSPYLPELFNVKSEELYLDGYFQSYSYFEKYRSDLIDQIVPSYSTTEEYLYYLDKINKKDTVAVHVRHGDFVKEQKTSSLYHYILTQKYYANAKNYIDQRISAPEYYVFTDDYEWTERIFPKGENVHFVHLNTQNPDIDELMLIKNCNHIITANSTFSWWAAWLNSRENSIKIVPKKAYGPVNMIPYEWIKMEIQ